MNQSNTDPNTTAPPARAVARLAAVALVTSAAATVLFVLPAEYGIDPTGIGAKLGLLGLADTAPAADVAVPRMVTGSYPGIPEDFDYFDPETLGEPYSKTHERRPRSDTLTIELDVGEQVEYKAVMQRGAVIVFSWRVAEGIVYTDFHADPGENADGWPEGYFIRYRESETDHGAGSLVAPFDGNHGWYWLNIEERPIRITLELHGYYERIDELFRSYQ